MSRNFTLIAALLATASPLAISETAAQEQTANTEEIVVTAQKREESLQDVPISIGVLSGDTLDAINADGMEDVARLVPSLAMTNISRGGNQVQIRGLGSNVANVGTVAIYNDGVIGANRIQSSGTFAEADSALFDIERVEVLRGPQGTLYGEGSFGGVINIVSHRPDLQQVQAALSATYAGTEHGDASDRAQLMLNLPIVRDAMGLRVVAYQDNQGGYIDSIGTGFVLAPLGELIEEDVNWTNITGARAILTIAPTSTFDATLTYKTEEDEIGALSISSPNVVSLVNTLASTSYDPDYSQVDYFRSGSTNDTDQLILEVNTRVAGANFTFISGYAEVGQVGTSGGVADANAWSNEARLSSDNDGALNWIIGAYQRSAERSISFTGIPVADNSLDVWAAFGQVYWDFMPNFTATVGLRYERQESEIIDQLNNLSSQGDFDSVIPKIAISWEPNDDTLYYVSAAQGFRGGGANIDESIGTDASFTSAFEPDTIWNYEAGAKWTLAGGTAIINGAVYHIDWTDVQIDRPIASLINPPLAFIVVNGEDAHATGIEVDVTLHPTPQWDIILGGSLVDAGFDSGQIFDDGALAFVPLDGQHFSGTPRFLFNASVERRFDLSAAMEGYLRADYSLRASSFGDVPNEAPPGGDLRSGESQIVNLRFGVRHATWDFQVFADNALDETASTFTFFDGGFVDQSVVLRPRTIGATLRLRYN